MAARTAARGSGWLGWVFGLALLVAIGAGAAAWGTAPLVQRSTESGIKYQMVREGEGARPGPSDFVLLNYVGRTPDGRIFDSTLGAGRPAQFQLTQVVPGFSEAVQLMRPGGRARVIIPANLAYGAAGQPPAIGPNEDLTFDIELLASVTEEQARAAQAQAVGAR